MSQNQLKYKILKEIDMGNKTFTEVDFLVPTQEFDEMIRYLHRENYIGGIFYADNRPQLFEGTIYLTEKGELFLKNHVSNKEENNLRKKINDLISTGYECNYLDFKVKQYPANKTPDLIKDVVCMANSHYEGDKFIIVGITDGGKVKGINTDEKLVDSATYQEHILEHIEPDITIDYFEHGYYGKKIGVFRILMENNDKPYLIKKELKYLRRGDCYVRKGSQNSRANRRDFDNFYSDKETFEMDFLLPTLRAVEDSDGVANLDVVIRNYTSLPITLVNGTLFIIDKDNNQRSIHPVFGLEDCIGADFKLSLNPKTEKVGDLKLGFTSGDCLKLCLDEHGVTEEKFKFRLVFHDTNNNEYLIERENCSVFAQGEFLWKVKLRLR